MNTLIDNLIQHASDKDGYVDKWSMEHAKSELLKAILEVIGDDEEIPMENRMSDPMQVREFNQLIKIVKSKNYLRQELRTKYKELFGVE